ncbi:MULTISPECIES: hypothetical protein [Wolbachia]|uniref:hypothetical protein n=1 Tax=Wolbachia TaxID=953 RepID=UPI001ABDDD89|nr:MULTISPECIES: hypothetical protein [Wolbachia]MDV6248643.1 hypothetical protein [Wolbachia endosymbiont of Zaprionus taronus]QTG99254.1 hypothetical protein J5252_02320 [Wolbachia pipientis]
MEKKEFNLDLLAPKDIVSYTYEDNYDTYFAEATKRLNILWAEYLKRGENGNRESKKHERPYT